MTTVTEVIRTILMFMDDITVTEVIRTILMFMDDITY
jgi:hypothetical protein